MFRICVALVIAFSVNISWAQETRSVIVEIENTAQPNRWLSTSTQPFGQRAVAPAVFPLVYAFHNGDLDLFDVGTPVGQGFAAMAKETLVAPLVADLRAMDPNAVVNIITNNFFGYDSPVDLRNFQAREQIIDPEIHRYFSYTGKMTPSDDAFVGNDDPRRIEVFNEQGQFMGPIVIDIYGSDVLDAGVRANLEQDVHFISDRGIDLNAGQLTDEPVERHPGYIGSFANPEGDPGILGVESPPCSDPELSVFCFAITLDEGDFSRPGYHLARIRITSGMSPAFDGFWYDPARSGEGFNFAVLGDPPVLGVSMYTYAPTGSGAPAWMVGSANASGNTTGVDLFAGVGGAFASTANPAEVEMQAWGHAEFEFFRCDTARVVFSPNDTQVPTPMDYLLQRVAPAPPMLAQQCGEFSLHLDYPSDDTWPSLDDLIPPDAGVDD